MIKVKVQFGGNEVETLKICHHHMVVQDKVLEAPDRVQPAVLVHLAVVVVDIVGVPQPALPLGVVQVQ